LGLTVTPKLFAWRVCSDLATLHLFFLVCSFVLPCLPGGRARGSHPRL